MDPVQDAVLSTMPAQEFNNTDNKLMTLNDAHQELERQGLSCHFINDHLLVGVLSECRWEMTAKMDVVVFVHQLLGPLTLDRLLADLLELPSLVEQRIIVAGTTCPPFGAARARQVMVIYYAETISTEVVHEIVH
jgi:hypothetical protein